MVRPDWRWDGDRRIVLYADDVPVVAVHKLTIKGQYGERNGFGWYLFLPDGQPVCWRGDQQVWRTSKAGAQRAAESFACGKEVYP